MQLFKNSFYVNKSQQISITDKRIYDIYSVYNKYIYIYILLKKYNIEKMN